MKQAGMTCISHASLSVKTVRFPARIRAQSAVFVFHSIPPIHAALVPGHGFQLPGLHAEYPGAKFAGFRTVMRYEKDRAAAAVFLHGPDRPALYLRIQIGEGLIQQEERSLT